MSIAGMENMISFPKHGFFCWVREARREKHCGYCKKVVSFWGNLLYIGKNDLGECSYVCSDCGKVFADDFLTQIDAWRKEIKADEARKKGRVKKK